MAEALTHFAPAERADAGRLARQIELLANTRFTSEILDAIPDPLLILNPQRQIVFVNQSTLALTGGDESALLGLRPGEALYCEHAWDCHGGCGTGEACSACDLVRGVLDSLHGQTRIAECSFIQQRDGQRHAFDLRATVRPLYREEELFSLVILKDIGHEKRRVALERIFFHDLMNSLGSVRGLLELVRDYQPRDRDELLALANLATEQAIDEIEAQRQLTQAENGELIPRPAPVAVEILIRELLELLARHELTDGKELRFVPPPPFSLATDRVLLRRILLNMLKNALEATPRGGTITVAAAQDGAGRIRLEVNNPGTIPEHHRYSIFQRSFSTKGDGRGLGTYGMRLLAGYLQGEVRFTSDPANGTTFSLLLPQRPD